LSVVTDLLPAAVLWDMDGTIVDTEPYWMAAEFELVGTFGGTWTMEDAAKLVGSGLEQSARILQAAGVTLSENEIIQRMTDRVLEQIAVEVPWRSGVRELLAELRDRGIKTALVTMSIRRMALAVAAHLDFDVVVAGDDVSNPKPHPEPYERAASLLGVSPSECVAVEDSAPGIASAFAAGARVIGVPLHVPVEPDARWTEWDGFDGRTVQHLADVYAGKARND
jgi:HAD superfamily hydrolase (TIGR01509 family)